MPTSTTLSYRQYQPWRRWCEAGFWLVVVGINGTVNSFVALVDRRREGADLAAWEPAVWEASSAMMWVLVLIPALAVFTARFPLHWDTWRRYLPLYGAASAALCLVHVGGMVALRELAYAGRGMEYEFGPWPRELAYEFIKDLRSFALIVAIMEAYRFVLRRWQGEARLLDAPDEGLAVEPVERPERFLVRKLGREFLVAAADIEWLQAAGNYVNLRVRGHDYPLRSTLAGIRERLDPRRFVRIHRSYLVAMDQVASIEPLDTGDARVHMKDGSVLPCSRRHRQALRERIDGEGAVATRTEQRVPP